MYKLKSLYNEIKIMSNPTGEIILKLVRELAEQPSVSEILMNTLYKYFDNFATLNRVDPYNNLSKLEKFSLFKELIDIKNNLNKNVVL